MADARRRHNETRNKVLDEVAGKLEELKAEVESGGYQDIIKVAFNASLNDAIKTVKKMKN